MLVFTHIPKTGGTSVNLNFLAGSTAKDQIQIKANYTKEEIYTFQTGARRSPNPDWPPVSFEVPCTDIVKLICFLHSSSISEIKLIKGHLPYGVHNYIDEPCYYFTVLRDPVDRVWSAFHGVVTDKGHYLHEQWRDKYKWNLTNILKDHPPELCNDQFRMMLGTSNVGFDSFDLKKVHDIVHNYSFITTMDRVEEIGSKFGYLFRWKHLELKRAFNVARYEYLVPKPSDRLRQTILDCNRHDLALYEYVKEKGIVLNMSGGAPFYD